MLSVPWLWPREEGEGKTAEGASHLIVCCCLYFFDTVLQLSVLCLNSYLSIQLCAGQSTLSVYIIFDSVLFIHIIVSPFANCIIATSSPTRIASYSYLSKFRKTLHTIFNFISVHHPSMLLSFLSYYRPFFSIPFESFFSYYQPSWFPFFMSFPGYG